jgi:RNA polymerase sigma-70 factor (ECF subfamily)
MPLRPRRDDVAAHAIPCHAVPEPELIERVRTGDERAFEFLFKTYYRPLCDFTYGFARCRDIAEELVQTVFLRIWEKRDSWHPAAGVRAYLFAACRNAALDHLRHERVVARAGGSSEAPGEPSAGAGMPPLAPDEVLHARELSDAFHAAVQGLPERRRTVLVLRWQHHLTNEEIARALGITVKGVEAHVTRSLAALRDRLRAFRP